MGMLLYMEELKRKEQETMKPADVPAEPETEKEPETEAKPVKKTGGRRKTSK